MKVLKKWPNQDWQLGEIENTLKAMQALAAAL